MTDRIEKHVDLAASVSRVWRALTDHREFGRWFQVAIEAPFAPGALSRGHITYPGYEHLRWEATITALEPEHYFAFRWHPYAVDPEVDYSPEPTTLVEFRLEPRDRGTRLVVIESGFDAIPDHRRAEAFRMNESGWVAQMDNVARYLDEHA